jgi:hypothetical protein
VPAESPIADPAGAIGAAAALAGRPEVVVGAGTGPGWVPWPELARPERAGEFVERTAAWCGGAPTATARTAAVTLLAGDLASALAGPLAAALVAQRRAVLVDAGQVAIRPGRDGVAALALDGPVLGVLAGDPLAGQDGVRTLPDAGALCRAVADGYVTLLAPVLDALRPFARRGPRGLWAEVADRLTGAVFLAARAAGGDGPAEVAALLDAAPAVLRHPVSWVDVPVRGGQVAWKRRTVCCLAYQTPRFAGQYCATCPLVPAAETAHRVGAWLGG